VSNLRRWSEEGATAHEISLLEASRSERAPPYARARTLKVLALAGVLTSATTTTTAAATTAVAAKSAPPLLIKILAFSLFGGIVAGGVVVGLSRHVGTRSSRAGAVTAPPTPIVSEPPSAILPTESASPDIPPVPIGAQARAGQPPAQGPDTDESLSREVAALELAHRALNVHNPDAALRLLDRYRIRFPHGLLSSEESVLRVRALLASGYRARAQRLADGYSAAHPNSPYAQRLEELVHSEQ
jgi:hypothetical protein